MNKKGMALMDDIASGDSTGKLRVIPAHEPSKMEIHAKRVLEDMREISAICNATGHNWALWTLFDDLMALAGDIERETDGKREQKR